MRNHEDRSHASRADPGFEPTVCSPPDHQLWVPDSSPCAFGFEGGAEACGVCQDNDSLGRTGRKSAQRVDACFCGYNEVS